MNTASPRIPRPILVITTLSLLLALLLALDVLPFLRGGFGWQWPYNPAPLGRALPLFLATAAYLVGAWLVLQYTKRAMPAVLWGFLGALVIPLTVVALRSDDVVYELFARTVSGVTTGPHLAAAELDWGSGAWRDWPSVMNSYEGRSVHVRLSAPGLPIWYGLLNASLEAVPSLADPLYRALLPYQCHNWNLLAYTPAEWASAWFGMLMPVWGAFTVFPLYGVARRLVGRQARGVALCWPLIPALAMFVPTWNTLFPLFTLLAWWLLLTGFEHKKSELKFAAAGLLTGVLTFANFSLVPLIGFFGLYILLHYLWGQPANFQAAAWQRPIKAGLWFGLGTALPWLIYGLMTGFTAFDLLRVALNAHLALDRPYLPWLWLHFWEWALFISVPLVLLWLLAAWKFVRERQTSGAILPLTLLLTMALLLLSGTARGETGRVWLFFAPFMLIAAASAASTGEKQQPSSDSQARAWLAISIGQATIMVTLAVTWAVIDAPDITPRPMPPGGLATTRPANATFEGRFRLVNWDASTNQDGITLRLDWQGIAPITTPYWFSALLVSPDGTPMSESVVWQPLETRYPITCWMPNEWVGDAVTLPLPNNPTSGEWWISLAAFADTEQPEQRLSVTLADGTQDTQVGLGPVVVP